MADEFDEFDIVHLSDEQVHEIVDWAVRTGAIIYLMKTYPASKTFADMKEQLVCYDDAIISMLENMPVVMRDSAIGIAEEARVQVAKEEATVAEFLEELEDL